MGQQVTVHMWKRVSAHSAFVPHFPARFDVITRGGCNYGGADDVHVMDLMLENIGLFIKLLQWDPSLPAGKPGLNILGAKTKNGHSLHLKRE